MKKNGFATILVLTLITVIVFAVYLWLKSDFVKKPDIGGVGSNLQEIKFLTYSISLPYGWHSETNKEVTSKFYKDDPIFGNKCVTSEDELKTIDYTSRPCHFLNINGGNGNKFITITDTRDVSVGGGGYVSTTTVSELIKANSPLGLQGKFEFVYNGTKDNIIDLYYVIGCFNTNLCIHSGAGVSYDDFKNFIAKTVIK